MVKWTGLAVLALVLILGAAFLVVHTAREESESSAGIPTGEAPPFPAPTWLASEDDGEKILLRWRSVSGALAYTIWRSLEPGGEFKIIHRGRDTVLVDLDRPSPGLFPCYQLTATDPEFDESVFSDLRCVPSKSHPER